MATIWSVSEDARLCETLRPTLCEFGEVHTGSLQRADFREQPPPDLLVLIGTDQTIGDSAALEQWLGFVESVPHPRRALTPKLPGTPPIRKPGRSPACSRIQASIEALVVLPWVPAPAST